MVSTHLWESIEKRFEIGISRADLTRIPSFAGSSTLSASGEGSRGVR